jgi:predicted DsbA family dithiol-disulfide isomerase
MLNSGWWELRYAQGTYPAASFVAEAAKDFGFTGDEIRLALSHACEREGRKVGQLDVAVEVAVAAAKGKLKAAKLKTAAESVKVRARIEESTKEYLAHQLSENQRPAYIITDTIGDKAVFGGLVRIEPLAAAIDAMLADVAAYAAHQAHFGDPPKR